MDNTGRGPVCLQWIYDSFLFAALLPCCPAALLPCCPAALPLFVSICLSPLGPHSPSVHLPNKPAPILHLSPRVLPSSSSALSSASFPSHQSSSSHKCTHAPRPLQLRVRVCTSTRAGLHARMREAASLVSLQVRGYKRVELPGSLRSVRRS